MSLDVYLTVDEPHKVEPMIYIREGGSQKAITVAEWNERHPDRAPVVIDEGESNTVYSSNITHNLNKMADAAGLYQYLWRPEELNVTTGGQLIEPLEAGLTLLESDPDRFKVFNPKNGWGDYDGLVEFVTKYLAACIEHPMAEVSVSR